MPAPKKGVPDKHCGYFGILCRWSNEQRAIGVNLSFALRYSINLFCFPSPKMLADQASSGFLCSDSEEL